MPAIINTNVSSLNAQRNLNSSQNSLATSLQRLSSGLRINSAKDDAAGLAISSRMTSQINGLNQATRNANDGISLAQTAEGALGNVGESLQRMRELAVQASNATNSAQDRAALQAEVDQLVQQINTVASQTSFNGIKVLDGTFNAQAFQVGANKGETISINSIASAKADSLGVGTTSSYRTSIDEGVVSNGKISSGGITVNGYGIGPTITDGVSTEFSATSTGAKVAADPSIRSGDAGAAAVSGGILKVQVNGFALADITVNASETAASAQTKVVDAFNTAKNNGADLLADISVEISGGELVFTKSSGGAFTVATAGSTGDAAAASGLDVISDDSTLDAAAGKFQITFGTETIQVDGDGAGGAMAIASESTSDQAAAYILGRINTAIAGASDAFKNAVSATVENGKISITALGGDLVLTDNSAVAGQAARTGVTFGTQQAEIRTSESSAISKAAAFNAVSGQTGVTAKATATSLTGSAVTMNSALAGDESNYVSINGVKLGAIAAGGNLTAQANNVAAAINAVSDQTGVTATFDTAGKLSLTAKDGRNIAIRAAGTGSTATGLTSGTTFGGLTLSSVKADGITLGGSDLAKAGLSGAAGLNQAEASFGTGVSTIDISTADGAQNAIATIDAALQNINTSRADLGAIQNRFSSVVSNLQTSAENITASRSRIMDTDFAAETANLSRAQILQQAGTAMLAQANQLPQNVLSLLR